jgi:membrane-anchored protein YejM (alkaline phosphatase superfamily)
LLLFSIVLSVLLFFIVLSVLLLLAIILSDWATQSHKKPRVNLSALEGLACFWSTSGNHHVTLV